MSHKTRAEQKSLKVRKDPKGLARTTRIHVNEACQACKDAIIEGLEEYFEEEGNDEAEAPVRSR